jgi:hypothetical protein
LHASVSVNGTSSGSAVQVASIQAATLVTVTSEASQVALGQSITFTATVTSPPGGTPTGTVTFTDVTDPSSPATLGMGTLSANGTAIFTISTLNAGRHLIVATYKGDSNFLPSAQSPSLSQGIGTPNQQFVDAAYVALFDRHAEPAGLALWSRLLDQGVLTRTQVAYDLTHSPEYYSTRIIPAYLSYLGRAPDPSEVQGWITAFQNGLPDEQLQALFIGSPEYYGHAGGTDKLWVDAMYHDLLGRTPSPAEEGGWLQALANGESRADVAHGFATSSEREGIVVQDDYFRYLGRHASPDEVAGWVNAFEHGYSNENVVAGFVGSDEYYNHHTQT